MAFKNKAIALILVACMVVSMMGTSVFAGGAANAYVEVTGETTVTVGDTITVVVGNKNMTVSSFAAGVYFPKALLTCESIVGVNGASPAGVYLRKNDLFSPWDPVTAASTTVQANEEGTVGMAKAGTADTAYLENTIFTITFTAKAAGSAEIILFEDSSGSGGFKSESVETKVITINPAPCTDHTFDKLIATEQYKAADATCVKGTLYYKSCECGEKGSETFESGEKNPNKHADGCTLGAYQTSESKHWKEYSLCKAKAEEADHSGDKTACTGNKECVTCGYAYDVADDHDYADDWSKDASGHWHACTGNGCDEKKDFAPHNPDHDGGATETYAIKCTECGYVIEAQLAHTHSMKKITANESSCTEQGNNEYWQCTKCELYYQDEAGTKPTTVDAEKLPLAAHDWEWVIDSPATEDAPGVKHEKCKNCTAVQNENTSIPQLDHTHAMTKIIAKESTCKEQGNNEYYQCTKCNRYYKDEAGQLPTTVEAEKLPLADHKGGTASDCLHQAVCEVCEQPYGAYGPHALTPTAANAETCDKDGNSAYWTCGTCGKYYSDAEGKQEIAKDSWVIAKHHTLTKIPGKAANCTETGKVDTWKCNGTCGKTYIDEAATTEATETNVVIAIIPDAHKWGDDNICDNNEKHTKTVTEAEPGTKVEIKVPEEIKNAVQEIVIEIQKVIEEAIEVIEKANWNTLFKDGSVEVVEGKLVYELLPDAPEGEYNIEITVDDVVYLVNVVVAEESVIVDRPDRPSYNSSAVKKVIEMIEELPSAKKVTLDDEEDIEAARKAYEKLSKADKAKVTNYEDLVEAEEALEALKKAEEETPVVTTNPFVDVDEDAYYADPVLWAVANNITSGTSAVTFSPDAVCTRAQVVTFLWRAAGCPAPLTSEMPFVDVEAGAYYAAAVQWAVENNITAGTSATTFDPNGKCTRGQIVTFLWRAQGNPAAAAVNNFVDVEDGAYYNAPVLWAVANGITNGTSTTTFSPAADCTRAQVVTFIYRCMAE